MLGTLGRSAGAQGEGHTCSPAEVLTQQESWLETLAKPSPSYWGAGDSAPHVPSTRTALRVTCPRAACSLVLAQWVPRANFIHLGPVGVDASKKTGQVST